MQAPIRRSIDLILVVSMIGLGVAWTWSRHSPKPVHSLAQLALPVSRCGAIDDGVPIIPQISRPIYRYAPVEYRDAFAPSIALTRSRLRPRDHLSLLGMRRSARDPFSREL